MYVRHEQEVVDQVLALAAAGVPKLRIANELGLAPMTVRRWIASGGARQQGPPPCTEEVCATRDQVDRAAYAYLLGQYLGDGWIDRNGRRGVERLAIACCATYPGIVDEVQRAVVAVNPTRRAGRVRRPGVVVVQSYSKHWHCLFPQVGAGPKHLRPIVLESWQEAIVFREYPRALVRGLIHSDGWRGINRVRGANGRRYEYTRYQFTNLSADIQDIFKRACDVIGVEWRQMTRTDVAVSRRASVALLDAFVGQKF